MWLLKGILFNRNGLQTPPCALQWSKLTEISIRNRWNKTKYYTHSYLVKTSVYSNLYHLSPYVRVNRSISCYYLENKSELKNAMKNMLIIKFQAKISLEELYTKHGSHIWVNHPRTLRHSPNSYIRPSNLFGSLASIRDFLCSMLRSFSSKESKSCELMFLRI